MIPAIAKAAEIVFVTAAVVLKMTDVVIITTKLKRKKMKNGPACRRNPDKKYRIMLKTTALANLIGKSATRPASASANGW